MWAEIQDDDYMYQDGSQAIQHFAEPGYETVECRVKFNSNAHYPYDSSDVAVNTYYGLNTGEPE